MTLLANDSMKASLTASERKRPSTNPGTLAQVRDYWNTRIHDLSITTQPIGTKGFFDQLEEYRFDKLQYLPRLVDFGSYRGLRLLEVGCGVGTDLVRFARGGAIVTGIDLSEQAIDLCHRNLVTNGVAGDVRVMNGEQMTFADNTYDVVYAHGVLQYTPNPNAMIRELHRVLRPGCPSIVMVYNRYSWLNFMSKMMHVDLEHDDAPVFLTFSQSELRELLQPFSRFHIIPERFPVPSRLHRGWKALLYNRLFVPTFNLLPRKLIRPLGWHLMATAIK
jgi:2-polyprenyl-3-methyl-5-hydroxy-6-metoxy-1,4-benzoquinol methylase